jgi:hypothetical protein
LDSYEKDDAGDGLLDVDVIARKVYVIRDFDKILSRDSKE